MNRRGSRLKRPSDPGRDRPEEPSVGAPFPAFGLVLKLLLKMVASTKQLTQGKLIYIITSFVSQAVYMSTLMLLYKTMYSSQSIKKTAMPYMRNISSSVSVAAI